jgi:SPP1 gp7 family putative phage head morphogenesis protein
MSSFVSFNQFVRHGGHATIVLSLRAIEPAMELKQARLDSTVTDAFEQRLRELAAENWSVLTGAFARAGLVADPTVEDVETEISRGRADFSTQASAIMATTDPSVADADVSTLSDWLARRFLTQINEWRQRRLGVAHFVWRTQDDEKVRAAHAVRDDRVYSWQDEFPDGPPGHGYNCRCVAEPAIVDRTILLTDFPTSPDLSERIAQAQADGLTDAAADAAAGGAISVYNLFRFSWLGYRRLFGVITPEEEAERLAMREGVLRAIESLARLDAETLRQLADAFVDHFDARHADLRLLDLEHRLGLVSEGTLLRAYREVAYLDGATALGATAFATAATRHGLDLTRLRPRRALVALRSATVRVETLLALRRNSVRDFVMRRFAELEVQGHGPQRHEGAVTRQMLIDRVLHGIDPMTGTRVDAVTGGRHRPVRTATRVTGEAEYVAAESFIRRSSDYQREWQVALDMAAQGDEPVFTVSLPLEDVLGSNMANSAEGGRRVGSFQSPIGVESVDFTGGRMVAVFELSPSGEPVLVPMYPIEAPR